MAVHDKLWRLTATEILSRIRNNQVSVCEYAAALLSHIKQRDPQIKAWVYLNAELVLARAAELDALPPSARGPLHGLAIGVKDTILTADMPTQHNSPLHYGSAPSTVDAACIRALRASGALIFGKTTTCEFAATTNANVNQNFTRNAHASNRTPGGSSSGSAAAVADFHVPVALGSQTGGSVVRPASYNGTWGIKFTWGAVSREGMDQHSVLLDTFGVFARSVEDMELIGHVLRVGDAQDRDAVPPLRIEGARVGFCKTHVWANKAGPALQKVWEEAKTALKQAGARVEEMELPPDFAKISQWHTDVLGGDGSSSFLGVYLTGKDKLDSKIIAHVENRNVSRKALLDAYDGTAALRPVFDGIANEYDVIITPSVPDIAPLGLGDTGDMSFNAMWTFLHVPTVNIPGLVGEEGMPLGLTAVGARYTDMKLLEASRQIGRLLQK